MPRSIAYIDQVRIVKKMEEIVAMGETYAREMTSNNGCVDLKGLSEGPIKSADLLRVGKYKRQREPMPYSYRVTVSTKDTIYEKPE